jgi:hypothetical protein
LEEYARCLRLVSWRVVIITSVILACVIAVFGITAIFSERFWVSWFCFGTGVIGGFVSIQQRLKLLSASEVSFMASSWVNVLLVPLFAGVFSLVLYLLFLSGLIEGDIFPVFTVPRFDNPATLANMRALFTDSYPASGQDFAKLAVWSFAAGFSERFIPDVIRGMIGKAYETQSLERTEKGKDGSGT